MSLILDIILVVILVAAFVIGTKKGFVKSVWKLAALVITIVLMLALKTPTVNFISQTRLAETINMKVTEHVTLPQGGGINIAETLNLPEFMQSDINNQVSASQGFSVAETVSSSLTSLFITIIACVGLFIAIRLILAVAFMIISAVTELPLIKSVNKLAGGVMAVVNVVFIVYLLLAFMSLFAPADSTLFENINNTYFVKYFYNYNILLQLFMNI